MATTDYPSSVPPGWHPDPNDQSQWRWWDGEQWTEQRAPRKPAGKKAPDVTVGAGYVTAFLFPIIGFFIGLALIARGSEHGIRVIAGSIAFGFLGYLVATGQV